jgi:gliding motility-associated-like protein
MKRLLHLLFCLVFAAPFLTAQTPCSITFFFPPGAGITCDDNGTPNDPSDDTFTFQVEIIGAGFGNNGWVGSDPLASTGPYDQLVTLGPYLIANGPFFFSAQDVDDPSCETSSIQITPPAPCSNASSCNISDAGFISATCVGGNVTEFVINPVGTNVSQNYFVSSTQGYNINPASGQYTAGPQTFTLVTIGPPPADLEITITDALNSSCTFTFNIPNPCANLCSLNASPATPICNDNGTPSDPSDDTFTFSLTVSGNAIGSNGWTANDPNNSSGNYGNAVVLGPYPISGGPLNITITDVDNPSCTTTFDIAPPPTCSNQPPCDINYAQVGNITCNDNGTPNDPSDDTFTFVVQVVGTGTSTNGWTISDPFNSTGQYNVVTTLGPYPIAGGGFTIIATDNDDPNCTTIPVTIVPPAPCSAAPSCNIQDAGLFNVACNDAGTPSNPSDDFITFSLSPTGQNLGAQYQVSVSSGTIFPSVASYGNSTGFETGPGTAGNGDITLTITDLDDPSCTLTITIPDPGNCSNTCNLQSASLSGVICNDNGTPGDPSDDFIEFVLNPTGQNTSGSYTVTSSMSAITPNSAPYGGPTAFQTAPGTAGNGDITLTITDSGDPSCFIQGVFLPDPGTCSNLSCAFTDPGIVSVSCDDAGTPNDPSDDFLLLDLFPIGVALSPIGYNLSSPDVTVTPGFGNLGVTTTFQLLGAAAAGPTITLVLSDIDHPDCFLEFTIDNPAPCSVPVCDIQPSIASPPVCDPAGTPTIPDDDQFTVNIFVGGTGNGWLADDPANTTGAYGTSVPFGPFPINGGPVTLTFTDVDDPSCPQTVIVNPPPTCSDLCNILPLPSPPTCDPAGTPFDPSDDIFFVDIQVNGTGTGWLADDPASSSGTFGQTVTFGPFPINGGPVNLTFSLLENLGCQESIVINPPPTCSDACDVQTSIDNITCNDDGTPATSDDDFFTAVLTVSGINVGTDWSAGPPANTTGGYDVPVAVGPFPTNQTSVTFTVNDIDNPSCNAQVTINSPGGCSAGCPSPDSTFLSATSCNPLDTGLTIETFSNSIGCDSLVFTTTSLLPTDTTLIDLSSCNPQDTGTVETVLTNQFGCDSLIIETTSLLPSDTTSLQQSSCNPQDTGTVETLLVNQFGCDSLVVTTTTFQLSDTTTLFSESCNPLDTGTVETLLANQFGCDSLVIEITSLLPTDTTFVNAQSCNPQDTGTVETLLTNQFGCDSLVINTTTLLPSDTTQLFSESCNPQDTGTVETLLQNQFGCDSLVVTTTNLLPSDTIFISLESCNPQDTGTVATLLTNQFGCDSLILETTTLLPTDTTFLQQTSCNPLDTGTVENLLANQFGCDSLIITTTVFQSSDTTQLFAESCNPIDTGTVETLLQNQFGCDSLVITTTTLLPSDTTQLFSESCNPIDTGTVETLLQNQFGCDSLVIITTTLLPSDTTQLFSESCNPIDTGTVETLLQNQFGCDSLVITTTTLLPSDTTQLFAESCNPIDTGTVETLLQNQFGCDSLVITTTTLLPSDTTLIALESCNPQDTGTVETLLQNQFGCDSLVITTTTLLPSNTTQLFSESCNPLDTGTVETLLQNQFGCDSLVITTTTLLPSDTTQLFAESCNPLDTGTVETLLQNQFGCDSLIITTTTLLPNPSSTLEPTICFGDSLLINGTVYDADNPSGVDTLTAANGCDSLVFINLQVLPPPVVQAIDTVLCPGQQLIVNGQVYDEDQASGTQMFSGQNGCDSLLLTITVSFSDPQVTAQATSPSCEGLPGSITISSINGGTPPFSYMLDGQGMLPAGDLPITIEGLFPDSYDLQIQDALGCMVSQSLSIAEGPTTVVDLGADLTVTLGDSIVLQPFISFDYDSLIWMPAEALSCSDCLNPVVNTTESITVSLLALDLQGCEAEDAIQILVDRRTSIYAPNVFSPNDDGRNDAFTLFANDKAVRNINRLLIFDRWGNQVFEGRNMTPGVESEGWDGRFKGELMNPAVFVFFAEITLADGSETLVEGEVILMR